MDGLVRSRRGRVSWVPNAKGVVPVNASGDGDVPYGTRATRSSDAARRSTPADHMADAVGGNDGNGRAHQHALFSRGDDRREGDMKEPILLAAQEDASV